MSSQLELLSRLEAAQKRLARKSDSTSLADAKRLKQVVEGVPIAEDIGYELPHTAVAVARALAPASADDVKRMLVGVAPSSVKLDEIVASALSKATELGEIAIPKRARVASQVSRPPPGEFQYEVSGKHAGKPISNQHNLDTAMARLGVATRFDEFAGRAWIHRRGYTTLDGTVVPARAEIREDRHLTGLLEDIETNFDVEYSPDRLRRYLDDLAENHERFHPVKDYFAGLPAWDGAKRIDTWLIDAGAPATEYVRAVSRLVLVAAVRRIYEPGAKFDELLVIRSPQGFGKSSALEALCPDPKWFSASLDLRNIADPKYMVENTTGKWIVESAELDGLSKADMGALKKGLAERTDTGCLKWQKLATDHPRQFVIIGTMNPEDRFPISKGDRRFWPVEITRFDVAKIERERDQMWAEAYAAHLAGESIRLAEHLWADAEGARDAVADVDPFREDLDQLANMTGVVASQDLWVLCCGDRSPNAAERKRIAAVMRSTGWDYTKGDRMKVNGVARPCFRKGSEIERKVPLRLEHLSFVAGKPESEPTKPATRASVLELGPLAATTT